MSEDYKDLYMCENRGCGDECSHLEVDLYKGANGEPVCEDCFAQEPNELWERRESWKSPKTLEVEKLRAENDELGDENEVLREWYENKYDCACGYVNVNDKCNLHSPHIHKLEKELSELKKANEWVNVKIAELPKPNTAVYVRTESGLEFYAYWREVKIGSLVSGYWYCKNKDYPESWTDGDCIGDLANGIKVDQVTHVNFNK